MSIINTMIAKSSLINTVLVRGLIGLKETAIDTLLLPLWVPNFNGGSSYINMLKTFTPSGTTSIATVKGIYKNNGAIQQLLAPDTSALSLTVSATDVVTFNLLSNVTIDGVAATSGVTTMSDGYHVVSGELSRDADIDVIASNAAFANNFQTQIHSVNLVDPLDGAVNGRSVLKQNGVNSYGQIPNWVPVGDFIVKTRIIRQSTSATEWRSILQGGINYISLGYRDGNAPRATRVNIADFPASGLADKRNKISEIEYRFTEGAGSKYAIEYIQDGVSSGVLLSTIDYGTGLARFNQIAVWGSSAQYMEATIINLELYDLDDSAKDRFYPMDTELLTDSLGDGSTDGVWYNSPVLSHRINNSTTIDTVIEAETMPNQAFVLDLTDETIHPNLIADGNFVSGVGAWGGPATRSIVTGDGFVGNAMLSDYVSGNYSSIGTTMVSGDFYKVSFMYRSNHSSNSIAVGGGNNMNIPVNTGDAILFEKTLIRGSGPTLYLVLASVGAYLEVSEFKLEKVSIAASLNNLGTDQPYTPLLMGGTLDRSYEVDKFEAFLGNYTSGNYAGGVSLIGKTITAYDEPPTIFGSYHLDVVASWANNIAVAKNGAVIKLNFTGNSDTMGYSVLKGTDAQIQTGFEYPNVFRVLKPDADTESEYYYYNNGGSYPWTQP